MKRVRKNYLLNGLKISIRRFGIHCHFTASSQPPIRNQSTHHIYTGPNVQTCKHTHKKASNFLCLWHKEIDKRKCLEWKKRYLRNVLWRGQKYFTQKVLASSEPVAYSLPISVVFFASCVRELNQQPNWWPLRDRMIRVSSLVIEKGFGLWGSYEAKDFRGRELDLGTTSWLDEVGGWQESLRRKRNTIDGKKEERRELRGMGFDTAELSLRKLRVLMNKI